MLRRDLRLSAQPLYYKARRKKKRTKNGELTRKANYDKLNSSGSRYAAVVFPELLYYK